MTNRTMMLAAAAVLLTTGGLMLWIVQPDQQNPQPVAANTAESADPPPADHPPAQPKATTPPAPTAPAPPAAPAAPKPYVDCTRPQGGVVRVGRSTISAEAFCRIAVGLAGSPAGQDPAAWRARAKAVRDRMVDAELVRQALAADNAAVQEAEVDAEVSKILNNPATTRPGAPPVGDAALLKDQVRARLELKKLVAFRGAAGATEAELRAAYAAAPAQFGEPAVAKIEPYLIRFAATAPPEAVSAAEQKAKAFYNSVMAGTSADAAAKASGLAAMPAFDLAEGGGEPQLVATVLRLLPGQWTEPVKTAVGLTVAKVIAVTPGKVLPFEEVRDRVRMKVMAGKGKGEVGQAMADLKAAGDVEDLVAW